MLRISELGARHKVRYVSKNPSQPGRVSITYHLNVAQDGAGPRYISFGGEVTTWMAVGFAPAAFHFSALFGTPLAPNWLVRADINGGRLHSGVAEKPNEIGCFGISRYWICPEVYFKTAALNHSATPPIQ
jgi:hypothetical protein